MLPCWSRGGVTGGRSGEGGGATGERSGEGGGAEAGSLGLASTRVPIALVGLRGSYLKRLWPVGCGLWAFPVISKRDKNGIILVENGIP